MFFVFLNLNQYSFSNEFEGRLHANKLNDCQSKETLKDTNNFVPELNLLCFPSIIHQEYTQM